jgi:hypothetical protein
MFLKSLLTVTATGATGPTGANISVQRWRAVDRKSDSWRGRAAIAVDDGEGRRELRTLRPPGEERDRSMTFYLIKKLNSE